MLRFARLYARSWPGVAGLFVFALFVFIGVAAPFLAPYDPLDDRDLATPLARPAWMGILPEYRNLPVTQDHRLTPGGWEIAEAINVAVTDTEYPERQGLEVRSVNEEGATVELRYTLDFPYDPPSRFSLQLPIEWLGSADATGEVRIGILTADGRWLDLWSSPPLRPGVSYRDPPIRVDSLQRTVLAPRLGLSFFDNVAEHVFNEPGTYQLIVRLQLGEEAEFIVGEGRFRIPGALHGWLGVDGLGHDLWSQFVYGARVSLLIGLGASMLATLIGTVVGIAAGYFGRWVDEFLMRFADLMLSLPLLPILMILAALVGRSVGNIVLLIGLTAWMGTARLVRSATLSLRERMFVDAARMAGAGPGYIMRVHILPHVSGAIITSLVLLMPTAIVAEATLSFLGFGDPDLPTWGRMLYTARADAAFTRGAWWSILPPGLGITALSLALVLIGHRLDDLLHRRDQGV